MKQYINVIDIRYRGYTTVTNKLPVITPAQLVTITGYLWWKKKKVVNGYAIVQAALEPDIACGLCMFWRVRHFSESIKEVHNIVKDMLVTGDVGYGTN